MRDHDDQDRPTRRPHRIAFRDRDAAPYDRLEDRVDLFDWAMTQPVSPPPGNRIASGILRAYGHSRPIAVDLTKLGDSSSYGVFRDLATWAAIEHPRPEEGDGDGN